MTAAVVARDVRKAYGEVQALRGVSLEVAEGEVFALLGPNGAGKTTLLEILEGFRRPDAGSVSVLGLDPHAAPRELRRQVGIVLQECALPPFLSVSELLDMTAAYYPAPRPVAEIVELVGLADKRDARVKTLSGGQQRRLDLAQALIGDPRLIVLDEPTTGFDPSARRAAWQLVRDIQGLGKTILLTTHYMDEAQHLADRIAVIAHGELIAEGDAASIGGRDKAAAQIRFALPDSVDPASLPVAAVAADGIFLLETDHPTRVLAELTGWAVAHDLELPGLSVSRPSLEDVYLELTRDD
ncbi:MAG TPA: ABC transporter ATP-binding protein [Candidatus Dormibacteraeota bacterium]